MVATMTRETLTRRELEVLGLLAAGLSNKEIGMRLGTSISTVEKQITSLYRKVGADSRVSALLHASNRGLIRLPYN